MDHHRRIAKSGLKSLLFQIWPCVPGCWEYSRRNLSRPMVVEEEQGNLKTRIEGSQMSNCHGWLVDVDVEGGVGGWVGGGG